MPGDPPPLLLDACGLLNLAAALPLHEAASALSVTLVCVQQVADESLYLDDEDDGTGERVLVDLAHVDILHLSDVEADLYVRLAVNLDDGESATLALAHQRGWPVMTDDRKARRIAQSLNPSVDIISTAAVLRQIAVNVAMPDEAVRRLLQNVERSASFTPPANDPHQAWWRSSRGPYEPGRG